MSVPTSVPASPAAREPRQAAEAASCQSLSAVASLFPSVIFDCLSQYPHHLCWRAGPPFLPHDIQEPYAGAKMAEEDRASLRRELVVEGYRGLNVVMVLLAQEKQGDWQKGRESRRFL